MTVCCVILMSEAKKNLNDILALYSTTFCSSAFPNTEVWNSAFATLCELQFATQLFHITNVGERGIIVSRADTPVRPYGFISL